MKNIQIPIPITNQCDKGACSVAVISAIYYYWNGFNPKLYFQNDFSNLLNRPAEMGVQILDIVKSLKELKFYTSYKKNLSTEDLSNYIKKGYTPIILMQGFQRQYPENWDNIWNSGHATALVGINKKRAFFMDPLLKDAYAWLDISEFNERWHTYNYMCERDYHGAILIKGRKPAVGCNHKKLQEMF
jgi:ABC-type bacteriocin/lantibiotic exporter with double-glycine peptidase domain